MSDHAGSDAALQKVLDELHAVRLSDVPSATAEYARLVLVDCIVCGIAGASLERGRMMTALVEDLGGPDEVDLLGGGHSTARNAAMANAEAMNALDADDTFVTGSHFGAVNAAVALAEGQRTDASWERTLLAFLVGYEINARLLLAARDLHLYPSGVATVGAAATAAVITGATPDHLGSALGLATRLAPGPIAFPRATAADESLKHAPVGAMAATAILAADLARRGFRGDAGAMPEFLVAQGAQRVDRAYLDAVVGTAWWIADTALKPYPSFRTGGHAALDAVRAIDREHGPSWSEVERVTVCLDPRARAFPFLDHLPDRLPDDHRAPNVGALHLPYCVAVTALGIPPGPRWYDRDVRDDPSVWALARKVTLGAPVCSIGELGPPDPRTGLVHESPVRVEVQTGDATIVHEQVGASGDPWQAEHRPDRAWLLRKAESFGVDAAAVERLLDVSLDDRVRQDRGTRA